VRGLAACHARLAGKACWAMAWWPSPAAEATRMLRVRWARCGGVTARSLRAGRRGGVLAGGPVMASR
jgi:hypothetical protein